MKTKRKNGEKERRKSSIVHRHPMKFQSWGVALDVAHGYKSEMVACGRLSGEAERKRALRLHLLPVNLETTPHPPP